MRKILLFSGLAALVLVALAALHFFTTQKDIELSSLSVQESATGEMTSEEAPEILGVNISPVDLPPYQGDPITNIGNDPFIQQVPADYFEKYKQELNDLKTYLTENPADAEKWLRLGVLKKLFNNYIGARDAWEYAKIVNPWLSISYYNLGDLYGWYLKEMVKAEDNYLKAIEIDPTLPYLYLGLADFYAVVYQAKADQAAEVIRHGLENLSDDEALQQALSNYQKEN